MGQCGSKLSVIVPVFNGEKYIARCLDSLINGEVYEIIVVDDGSSDCSRDICEQYADRFPNIFLLCNDQNKGVTYSRYAGLHHAAGEYISFVDADDWVEPSFFAAAENLMEENREVDIVVGKMIRDDAKGRQQYLIDFSNEEYLNHQEALEELFLWNCYRWEMCGKVYRKGLFAEWQPDFSVKVCEDLDCNWQVFQKANKTLALPLDFYHYYFNEDSVTGAINCVDDNSYQVFERILMQQNVLREEIYTGIVQKHYVLTLVNIVRTLILNGGNDEEILYYQTRGKRILTESKDKLYQEYADIFESPQSARKIVNKVECEICKLADELLQAGKIYLYGTGIVAGVAGFLLKRNGYDNFEYVVSDNQFKRSCFEDRQVHYLRELKRHEKIILTLNRKTQTIIKDKLLKQGFLYVYPVNTYEIM